MPPAQNPTSHPVGLALHALMQCLDALEQAGWRLADMVRIHQPGTDAQWAALPAEVLALAEEGCALYKRTRKAALEWHNQAEHEAIASISRTPEQARGLREKLARTNSHLQALYPQLLTLARQSATSVQQVWQAPQADVPLMDVYGHVTLNYILNEADPRYDERMNNSMAEYELLSWSAAHGDGDLFDEKSHSFYIENDWLDYSHRWMTQQCLLAHDVLEHNHGEHPLSGLTALLRVQEVRVDVHTVHSYVFDLQQGRFVSRDQL